MTNEDIVQAIHDLQAALLGAGVFDEVFLFGLMGIVCAGFLVYAILHNM